MPRNVRNFWIQASIDGINTSVATGPRSKDGGFSLTIKQRDGGDIITALEVRGFVNRAGELVLEATSAYSADGPALNVFTKR